MSWWHPESLRPIGATMSEKEWNIRPQTDPPAPYNKGSLTSLARLWSYTYSTERTTSPHSSWQCRPLSQWKWGIRYRLGAKNMSAVTSKLHAGWEGREHTTVRSSSGYRPRGQYDWRHSQRTLTGWAKMKDRCPCHLQGDNFALGHTLNQSSVLWKPYYIIYQLEWDFLKNFSLVTYFICPLSDCLILVRNIL